MNSENQVSIEALEGLERKMTVAVPSSRIDEAVDARLRSLTKTVRMDGFRPGKVPLRVVQKRYGPQVRQEVMGEVIQSSFQEAVIQEQLVPAGPPSIEPLPVEDSAGDFRYSAIFEVYPEVEVDGLDKIKVERIAAEIEESDVDDMLETLRKQRTEWDEVERAAADGDRLTIDFEGTSDGEPIENASASDYPLVLGGGALIPGFEEQLTGASAGDEKTVSVTFPEGYKPDELAGKPAEFSVKVTRVEEPRLPDIDDDFAAAMGVTDGGVAVFRDNVRGNMQRELDQNLRNHVKQQVMDGLLEVVSIDLPGAMIRDEIGRLKEQMAAQQGQRPDLDDSLLEAQARRRVSLGLLVAEIVKQQDIKVEADKVREAVEEIAAPYEEPRQVIDYYYGNKELLGGVEAMVLESQVVDWVLEQAQVEDVTRTFKEVMKPGEGPGSQEVASE